MFFQDKEKNLYVRGNLSHMAAMSLEDHLPVFIQSFGGNLWADAHKNAMIGMNLDYLSPSSSTG